MDRKRRVEILAVATFVTVLALTGGGLFYLHRLSEEMLRAAARGDAKAVQSLLEQGANIQARTGAKETALLLAARRGSEETVQLLLEKGADPNARDKHEVTALWWVSATVGPLANRAKLANLLLQHGADANVRGSINGGATSLSWAAAKSEPELARVLVQHGAEVNARIGGKWTALTNAQQVVAVHTRGVATLQSQIARTPPGQATSLRSRLQVALTRLRKAEATVQILKQAGATKKKAAYSARFYSSAVGRFL